MNIESVSSEFASKFLDAYHPLGAGGSLKGQLEILAGFETG